MDETSLYERILSLSPPWFVEAVELDENTDTVNVFIEVDRTHELKCPICEKSSPRYDARSRTWRHLDSCQFKTLVHASIPRVHCAEHGVLQIDVPWAENRSGFTLLFEQHVIRWLKVASINAVRQQLQLSWNAVDGIMQRAVKRGLAARTDPSLKHLAVDEVSRKKGHDYVTVLSNEKGHVLDIQEGRAKHSLMQCFSTFTHRQRRRIQSISLDMSGAYLSAIKDTLPQWKRQICFDKFHVAMDLNKAVNRVRKHEMKHIDAIYRQDLHRSKYTWLRAASTLTEIHQQTISNLSQVVKQTARAWAIRQYAMDLWQFNDKHVAEAAWEKWYSWAIRSRLQPMKTAAKSIKKNLWGIINAIIYQKNNAQAESINSRIKILKVRAKGFRNYERFKTTILFHLGGLDLYPKKSPT